MKRTGLLIGAAVGLSLGLAACGSGSPGPAAPAGKPTTTSGTLPTVKIAKASNTEDLLAVELASKEGFFKKAGIRVQPVLLSGSSVANAALEGGSVQFTLASAASALLASGHGVHLQAVGAVDQDDPAQLVVASSWVRKHQLSATAPLKARISGLTGTTFATLSTSDSSVMSELEKDAGVSPSSIHSVSISSESAMLTAVQHGVAQEFIASPPTSNLAVANGYGTVLAKATELKYASDEEYNVLITTPAYAQQHPKVVTAVTSAIGKALALMSEQSPSALAVIHEKFPTLSSSVIRSSLTSIKFAPGMQQSQQSWNDALSFSEEAGLVKSASSVNIHEGGIWTNSYLGH